MIFYNMNEAQENIANEVLKVAKRVKLDLSNVRSIEIVDKNHSELTLQSANGLCQVQTSLETNELYIDILASSESFSKGLLLHELCHADDANKRYLESVIEAMCIYELKNYEDFNSLVFNNCDFWESKIVGPKCWTEYYATRKSSFLEDNNAINNLIQGGYHQVKDCIDGLLYNRSDPDGPYDFLDKNAKAIVRMSYILGALDGLDLNLKKCCPELYDLIMDSYFRFRYLKLCEGLRYAWDHYPWSFDEREHIYGAIWIEPGT